MRNLDYQYKANDGMISLIVVVLNKNEKIIIYMIENHSDMPRVVSENAWNWRDKLMEIDSFQTFTSRPQPRKHESMLQKIGNHREESRDTRFNVENPVREKPREYKTPN